MFNFKTLKLTKRCDSESTNSFVGIRRNENSEVEFRLPHGFDDFPENDFEATKDLFFKMYRTFKKFERDNWRQNILDTRSAGKDQVQKEKEGYRFKNKEDNDVVLYSKIALIENLLDVYRDLALDQMERRIGADEKVDYSKIDRYLDRAIYLPKDVIYIDEMDLPRQTLRYESTTLIDLFCFIVCELQNELTEDIEPRVQELAHRFSEQHLSYEESLFNEETFETTIRTLKGALDDIDKRTAYKDEDYWRLYDAIETFLYGELDMDNPHEDGTFWGISNFSSVWEDMCSTYFFIGREREEILYADTNIILNGKCIANAKSAGYFPIYKKENFDDPFFIEFRDKKRWLRPDLICFSDKNEVDFIFKKLMNIVIKSDYGLTIDFKILLINPKITDIYKKFCLKLKQTQKGRAIRENEFRYYPKVELEKQKNLLAQHINIDNQRNGIQLFDWKYMDLHCFTTLNKKIEQDVVKQLCYEFSLQKKITASSTRSMFFIPWFYEQKISTLGNAVEEEKLTKCLRDSRTIVLKADFLDIQETYLYA
ncbi:MAG: hypothetical protein WBI40_10785 [Methylococcaceae bacterium]